MDLTPDQKIHHFIMGLKPKLKESLLIQQRSTFADADQFTKRKDRFTQSSTTDNEIVRLLKDIKTQQTQIKQEPYTAAIENPNDVYQKLAKLEQKINLLEQGHQHSNMYQHNHNDGLNFNRANGRVIYHRCNKVSHYARDCRSNPVPTNQRESWYSRNHPP